MQNADEILILFGGENIKQIKFIVVALYMICLLSGCSRLLNIEYENVEVVIVTVEYTEESDDYYMIGGVIGYSSEPEEYIITVIYDDFEYDIDVDEELYEKYKDKVGQTTMGTLEIRTYDDGTVKYDVVELED